MSRQFKLSSVTQSCPSLLGCDCLPPGSSVACRALAKVRKPPWPVTWMKSSVRKAFGLETMGAKQRYFPQCRTCSQKQAAAVRSGRRTLVFHFGGPRAYYFSGESLFPKLEVQRGRTGRCVRYSVEFGCSVWAIWFL